MSKAGALLSARIINDLEKLSKIVARAERGWALANERDDDYYLDGVALNLHGFYACLERIFEKIASGIDETVPNGSNWHRELLDQMTIEVPGLRPAVISSDLKNDLDSFRGFRHVVRNVYTFQLSPDKIEPLVSGLQEVYTEVKMELFGFCRFLQSVE